MLVGSGSRALSAQERDKHESERESGPIVIAKQGSFFAGGTAITNPGTFDPFRFIAPPDGQTFHGDHAYVQYQIPPDARDLPLVMWHGGGLSGKQWESTPDGREGYQTIFLRRGFAVYILDQPARGRAGRSTVGITITPRASEQSLFAPFGLGIWPNFFPNAQFPRDSASLDQFWRQQTPNTGPGDTATVTNAVAALFAKIGPAVLLTHSASGGLGFLTAMKSANVKAIISYDPGQVVFPMGEVPPPIVTPQGTTIGLAAPASEFAKLTKIPIQIVWSDNIPTSPSPYGGLDLRYRVHSMAALFVDAVNRHGGDASILNLPDVGLHGNTHFAFSDLNNLQVADLLSHYLHEKGLDRPKKRDKGKGKKGKDKDDR